MRRERGHSRFFIRIPLLLRHAPASWLATKETTWHEKSHQAHLERLSKLYHCLIADRLLVGRLVVMSELCDSPTMAAAQMLGMLSEAPAPSQVKPSVFRRRNSNMSAYAALGAATSAAASLISLSPAADSGTSPRAHNNLYAPYQKVRARTRPGSAHRSPRPPFSSPCASLLLSVPFLP